MPEWWQPIEEKKREIDASFRSQGALEAEFYAQFMGEQWPPPPVEEDDES